MDAKKFNSMFANVNKLNPDGALLSENSLSLVDGYISTGSMVLNAICSGSLFGGIPKGRIVGLSGPSGCGKTLMVNKIIANFQKENKNHWALVWDSEIAEDAKSASSVGADPERIQHYPIDSVPNMKIQIMSALNTIIENGKEGEFIIAIDSLGNLSGGKEMSDAENGKSVADMGTRAKEIKSMLRTLTYKAARAKTSIVFTNHIYGNPAALYESIKKQTSGGKGPEYLASLLIQFSHKFEKHDETDSKDKINVGAKKYSGLTLHALTVKNRFIPQFLTADLYLNWKTGFNSFSGLFELAKQFGIIEGNRTYSFEGKKLGFYKDWKNDKDVWKMLIPKLEAKIKSEWQYSNEDLSELEDLSDYNTNSDEKE